MNVYSSAAAMHHLEGWQATVSRNLSAGQQPGYKALQVSLERPEAGRGGKNLPMVAHETRNLHAASARATDRALDVAISGDGLIAAQDSAGAPVLLRNGALHIDATGRLTNGMGWQIDGRNGPIQAVVGDEDPHIDERGEVWQGDVNIGRVRVVTADRPEALVFDGAGWRLPGDGSVVLTDLDEPELLPGHLEEANFSPLQSMVTLIQVTRAFEANQKALQAADQVVERTIQSVQ